MGLDSVLRGGRGLLSVPAAIDSSFGANRSLSSSGTYGGWFVLAFFTVFMLVFFGCGYCLCLREGPLPFCCCARRRRVDDDDDDSQSSRVLCCVLQSGGRFVIRGRQESDEEYRRAVLRRERLERERQLGTPEQRRRKVLQSFARCKVIKVVKAEDLIAGDDDIPTSQNAKEAREAAGNSVSKGIDAVGGEPEKGLSSPIGTAMRPPLRRDTIETGAGSNNDSGNSSTKSQERKESQSRHPAAFSASEHAYHGANDTDLETGSATHRVAQEGGENSDARPNENEQEAEEEEEEDDCTSGYLRLTARRRVPNCCAICLSGYEVGDKVVWSSNKKCKHAFHRDCALDWFIKIRNPPSLSTDSDWAVGGTLSSATAAPKIPTPCPCCRREFTDVEKHRRDRRIRWGSEYAFNPNFIRWR